MTTVKALLLATAVVELGTGLALLLVPAAVLGLLLGLPSPALETQFVGRVAGAALLAIGMTSGLAQDMPAGATLRGVLVGIVVYDVLVAALLAYAGAVAHMAGVALWPAVVLHTALAVWVVRCLGVLPRAGPPVVR